jgi:hypothetical protein
MILKTILRAIWVACAFVIAAGVALAVLFALGSNWVGDQLRAAAPHDPILQQGAAPIFGMVMFAGAVAPALTALPALAAIIAGEVLRIRSWIYYVLAGGASLAAIPLLVPSSTASAAEIVTSHYMTIFLAAGFAGGFVYWLLAGARA